MEENYGKNNNDNLTSKDVDGAFSDRTTRWVSGISGGLAGALLTALVIVIPVINTWLTNTKEISMAQIENSAEQINYISKRMEDSNKERDFYKNEMLQIQNQLRELEKKCRR